MAIQSLFGPSVADIQELRRQQAEREIAASGGEFGVFAPLYRAGSRFGRQAAEGINTLMGAQDPMLKKAADIQSVLSKYQNEDLTSSSVLGNIARELAAIGYSNEAVGVAQQAAARRQQELETGFRQRQLDISERQAGVSERQVGVAEETLAFNKDKFTKIELPTLLRQNKITDAQVREIEARIANMAADKFNFTPIRDALGNVSGVLAINKSNPNDVKTINLGGTTPAAGAAAGQPGESAADALKRRREAEARASRQSRAGEVEYEMGPDGEMVATTVRNAPASQAQINEMSRTELQEYYRSGKIPQRLIGK
jgi:hypothetical protein